MSVHGAPVLLSVQDLFSLVRIKFWNFLVSWHHQVMKYAWGRMCAANCRESGACSYKQAALRVRDTWTETFRHTVTSMHTGEDKLIGVGCKHKIWAGTASFSSLIQKQCPAVLLSHSSLQSHFEHTWELNGFDKFKRSVQHESSAASSLLDTDKKQQNDSRQQGYINKPMRQRAAGGKG